MSPQGAFTSCDSYAVKIGAYHYLTGTIFGASKPVKVTITGPGGRQTDETDGQVWTFAVKNGTYVVSFTRQPQALQAHASRFTPNQAPPSPSTSTPA